MLSPILASILSQEHSFMVFYGIFGENCGKS